MTLKLVKLLGFRKYSFFFAILSLLYIIMKISVLSEIVELDKEFFLYLNSINTDWMNPIMLLFSSRTVWASAFVLVMAIMIFRLRKTGIWASLFLLLSLAANFLINHIVKIIVLRPRPIHEEAFPDIMHAIEGHEDSYSFYSAHSSNSFCLAIFSLLVLRNKYYSIAITLWAFTVAYSRIYVGKHYPGDVICGIICGTIMGIIGYRMFEKFREKKLEPAESDN